MEPNVRGAPTHILIVGAYPFLAGMVVPRHSQQINQNATWGLTSREVPLKHLLHITVRMIPSLDVLMRLCFVVTIGPELVARHRQGYRFCRRQTADALIPHLYDLEHWGAGT